MKKITLLTILCVTLVFTSCGTLFTQGGGDYREGVSLYESKEYVQSLDSLQSALIKNPEFLEASSLYPIVFNEGSQYYKSIISENISKETPNEADMVYDAYYNLQQLHQKAKNSLIKGLDTEDFTTKIEESNIRAAEIRFTYAEGLEATGERANIKNAVVQYEIVKERNSQFPDIDKRIEEALRKAHVTLMVLVRSEMTPSFHSQLNTFIQNSLTNNRFVTVIKAEDFQNKSTNKEAAITWGIKNHIDYMLYVHETKSFNDIAKLDNVVLPSSTPTFKGAKLSYGFSKEYKLAYSIIKLDSVAQVVVQDVVQSNYTSPLFSYSFVSSDGSKDLNLEETGTRNYRYVLVDANTEYLATAISNLRSNYANIYIPGSITDTTDETEWTKYYAEHYNSLDSLVANEGGGELFLDLEMVLDTNNGYFLLGANPTEAIQKAKVNSAIMSGRARTALNIIASEKEKFTKYIDRDTAAKLGNYLNTIF